MIIAREKEISLLKRYYLSDKSEFVVVKGRRRVGKTYLIREYFKNEFFFEFTGIINSTTKNTMERIAVTLNIDSKDLDWFKVFEHLVKLLKEDTSQDRKVIFLDEISWLDTKGSNFISALEYAWNSFFQPMKHILLIVSGSATTWIMNNLVNNTGGLYRRVTGLITINPFQLFELKEYFNYKNFWYTNMDICEIYCVFGGIPFYLDQFNKEKTVSQNIDDIVFNTNGILKNEFENIYNTLFYKSPLYIEIIKALSTKRKGLMQKEISDLCKIKANGRFTKMLDDLIESNIIRQYYQYPFKKQNAMYQLIDNFSCFATYFENEIFSNHYSYSKNRATQKIKIYLGFAFERVCLWHINQIEQGLKFNQITNTISSYKGKSSQIDLIFERADRMIHLIEVKYSDDIFVIDKKYHSDLLNKIGEFNFENNIKKSVVFSMITTQGVQKNNYSSIVHSQMVLEDLFKKPID